MNNGNESAGQTKTSPVQIINIRPVSSMTCYICLDNIIAMNKPFGIQNNCDHVFCFDCLLTWRRTSSAIDKDTSGRCPLCRVRSTFIARSWRCFDSHADKQLLIDAHKLRLKSIPCRAFSRYGQCRFGYRCYYNHRSSRSDYQPLNILQRSVVENLNEHDIDEQQQPTRRFTYNSYRYRPY